MGGGGWGSRGSVVANEGQTCLNVVPAWNVSNKGALPAVTTSWFSGCLPFRAGFLRSAWLSEMLNLERLSCNDNSTKDQEGFRSPGETSTSAVLSIKVSPPAKKRKKKCFSLQRTRYAGCSFTQKCCLLLIRLCACPSVTPRFSDALPQCLDWGLTPVLHPDVTFLALLLHLSSWVGAPPLRHWLSS